MCSVSSGARPPHTEQSRSELTRQRLQERPNLAPAATDTRLTGSSHSPSFIRTALNNSCVTCSLWLVGFLLGGSSLPAIEKTQSYRSIASFWNKNCLPSGTLTDMAWLLRQVSLLQR